MKRFFLKLKLGGSTSRIYGLAAQKWPQARYMHSVRYVRAFNRRDRLAVLSRCLFVATHVPSSFFWYLIGAPTADRGLVADCSDSLLKVFRANPAYRDEIETASQSQTLKSEPVPHDRLAEHTEQWEMLRVETLRSDFPGLR
jgi:hypothetical protein